VGQPELLEQLPAPVRDKLTAAAAPSELQSCLETLWTTGRQEHPELEVPAAAFCSLLAARLDDVDEQLLETLQGLDGAELYLACGCQLGLPAALRVFDARYVSTARPALLSMGLSAATIDDVQQQVREKLLVSSDAEPPRICRYAGGGQLGSLVRVVATRAAVSLMRKRKREQPADSRLLLVAGSALATEPRERQEHCSAMLKQCFEQALQELPSRDRDILRFNLLEGMEVGAIGLLYGVHRGSVSRWLTRARRLVKKRTRELLQQRLGVSEGELSSMIQLVEARFDVTLERVLQS